ncbi:MAG: hypothetical protein Q4C13_04970, partial [Clostridia bacterium]|nr:hypothetical protein [Clostridia bacterium]
DEDFDALPKKRGKATTFLFWGLIVLLIAVIVICGKVIADRNFDGDIGRMFASIGSIFGGEQPADAEDPADPAVVDGDAGAAMYTATISPYTDEAGTKYFDVTVYAPTGSTVQIVSDAPLDNDSATVTSNDLLPLRIVESAFLPNTPCESEIVTVTPNIQVTTPEGETRQIAVDPVSITVPVLSIALESPAADTIQATYTNDPIVITGTADDPSTEDDHTVEVYINGVQVPVYDGGQFTYNYTPTIAPTVATDTAAPADTAAANADAADDAEATTPPTGTGELGQTVTSDDGADDTTVSPEEAASDDTAAETPVALSGNGETITIEARKNNCVTATRIITVEPYVFQNMALLVTNDQATGLSSSEGSVTLQGTVTPGASLAVSSDSDKVSFGEPSVSATGNFTVAVTISTVGAYNVTLTATQAGYNDTTTTTIVERPPADTYKKFQSGAKSLTSILTDVTAGTTSSGDVYFTGTVTEILGTSPYTVFKVQLNNDEKTEIVCVNRSTKSTINSGDVKERKQLFGSLFGFYNDTTTPYVWVWFILNK